MSSTSALDILPESNDRYGTQTYWDERYVKEGPDVSYDWFLEPEYLLPFLQDLIANPQARILHQGCGNSRLGEVLAGAGYDIVNTDYVPSVISQMQAKRPDLVWQVQDCLNLTIPDGEYDIVIEKGLMDSFLTTKGDPWNPPERDQALARKEVSESLRVLKKKPGSKFIYATFGQPHFRKKYLDGIPQWRLSSQDVGPPEGFSYWLYCLEFIDGEGA